MTLFVLVLVGAAAGGAVAALSGFGMGSLLTPIFATRYGTKLAVAIVSVPHAAGTAIRFIGLRQQVNWKILVNFGIARAAGGLLGAWLNSHANSPVLAIDCLRRFAYFQRCFRADRLG